MAKYSSSRPSSSFDAEETDMSMSSTKVIGKERSYSQVDTRDRKGCIPLFFERASARWWNPTFDSRILEDEFQRFTFTHNRRRLLRALIYVMIVLCAWALFFVILREQRQHWLPIVSGSACFLVTFIGLFVFIKFCKLYKKITFCISLLAAVMICVGELSLFAFSKDFTAEGMFTMCTGIILLIYTMLHSIPLYICTVLAVSFSVIHEILSNVAFSHKMENRSLETACRILLHVCLHMIGIQIYFMAQVRERSTFWKVGQSVVAKRDLEIEKQVIEKMIRAVMPEMVAKSWMKTPDEEDEEEAEGKVRRRVIFRSLNIHQMSNVSILFADIVGFTKMSSNKTAEQLVRLLNDLFGRFDKLTEINNCEKISTLGDCYYCVAGCPVKTEYHAFNCVEMGLDMVDTIKEFDRDTNNDVDMRVGVHTGTVLCGLVGSLRVKFDVWSNDVTLANKMETAGVPGKVHITESTYKFLDSRYIVEDGNGSSRYPALEGIKTFLIVGRRNGMRKPLSTHINELNNTADSTPDSPEKRRVTITDESIHLMETLDTTVNSTTPLQNGPQKGSLKNSQLIDYDKNDPNVVEHNATQDATVSFNEALTRDTLRTSSDRQLVNLMRVDKIGQLHSMSQPLARITNTFQKRDLERKYRNEGQDCTLLNPSVTTFASPRVNFFFDVVLSNLVYITILVVCLLVFQPATLAKKLVIPFAIILEVFLFVINYARAFPNIFPNCFHSVIQFFSGWIMSHVVGALLMCLPMVSILSSLMECSRLTDINTNEFYANLVTVALLHFCNFTQLMSLMKTCLAAVFAAVFIALLFVDNFCTVLLQSINPIDESVVQEIMLGIILLVVLVCFLNRQLELGVRMNFSGDYVGAHDKNKAQTHKQQVDWLLESIIPKYVSEQLKVSKEYSSNYDNVGVAFSSIVNFNEFYEETYQGGKECIRVLNELIGDFDELLIKQEYCDIEKIKTVNGSTYMMVSGLNPNLKRSNCHPHEHLRQLIEFALAMNKKIEDFNMDMLGFSFILRTGFNCGPATAGVIGTTKLYYDIWGDTVNVASRMEYTGYEGKVHVSEQAMLALGEFFYFEKRGTIPVKGKGELTTYILSGRKQITDV